MSSVTIEMDIKVVMMINKAKHGEQILVMSVQGRYMTPLASNCSPHQELVTITC